MTVNPADGRMSGSRGGTVRSRRWAGGVAASATAGADECHDDAVVGPLGARGAPVKEGGTGGCGHHTCLARLGQELASIERFHRLCAWAE